MPTKSLHIIFNHRQSYSLVWILHHRFLISLGGEGQINIATTMYVDNESCAYASLYKRQITWAVQESKFLMTTPRSDDVFNISHNFIENRQFMECFIWLVTAFECKGVSIDSITNWQHLIKAYIICKTFPPAGSCIKYSKIILNYFYLSK